MRAWRIVASSVLLLALGYSLPYTVVARQWRTTPRSQALHYAQIIDQRSKTELVLVFWVPPEIVDGNSPETERARSVLREYMLVGVGHAHVSPAGQFTFERPTGVLIQTADGKARQPLNDKALPPAVIDMIAMFQAMFSQPLGPFGQAPTGRSSTARGSRAARRAPSGSITPASSMAMRRQSPAAAPPRLARPQTDPGLDHPIAGHTGRAAISSRDYRKATEPSRPLAPASVRDFPFPGCVSLCTLSAGGVRRATPGGRGA